MTQGNNKARLINLKNHSHTNLLSIPVLFIKLTKGKTKITDNSLYSKENEMIGYTIANFTNKSPKLEKCWLSIINIKLIKNGKIPLNISLLDILIILITAINKLTKKAISTRFGCKGGLLEKKGSQYVNIANMNGIRNVIF